MEVIESYQYFFFFWKSQLLASMISILGFSRDDRHEKYGIPADHCGAWQLHVIGSQSIKKVNLGGE
jgi:hypothetical protein